MTRRGKYWQPNRDREHKAGVKREIKRLKRIRARAFGGWVL